jgi:hypothetical protein
MNEEVKELTRIKYKLINEDGIEILKSILRIMLDGFETIFCEDMECGEILNIIHDKNADFPMLITNHPSRELYLRLSLKSLDMWTQLVYQLSHEMCHYFIRQTKTNKDKYIRWVEETICEAVSLYILDYFSRNWKSCELF